jgi:nitrate reductase delta subunit
MQHADGHVFERMAALFAYPHPGYLEAIGAARDWAPVPAAAALGRLADAIGELPISRLEELYIETFDMNPDAALEIGWHLFGEDYARGEFLVKLREENRRYGIDERGELPDNLTVVLRLLAKLPPSDEEAFARQYIAPAVRKMSSGIKRKDNPYLNLLEALLSCLGDTGSSAGNCPEFPVLKETCHG